MPHNTKEEEKTIAIIASKNDGDGNPFRDVFPCKSQARKEFSLLLNIKYIFLKHNQMEITKTLLYDQIYFCSHFSLRFVACLLRLTSCAVQLSLAFVNGFVFQLFKYSRYFVSFKKSQIDELQCFDFQQLLGKLYRTTM